MTRYISWVLEVDIELSSSSQLITLTSNHKRRIGVHRFKLLARHSRSSSTSTPTSLGHNVTLPSTPSTPSQPSQPSQPSKPFVSSLCSLRISRRRLSTHDKRTPSDITPVRRPPQSILTHLVHPFSNTTPPNLYISETIHITTKSSFEPLSIMFDHFRSMPAVCEVEECEEVVVGEDAWCGWCRVLRCRAHYDAAEHVCRYIGLVSLSSRPSIIHADQYRTGTLRRV